MLQLEIAREETSKRLAKDKQETSKRISWRQARYQKDRIQIAREITRDIARDIAGEKSIATE